MAITKAKKEEVLSKLEGIKGEAKTLVFVGFNKLTVADSTVMRRKLRANGVGYFVAKKTLIERALKGSYEGEMPALEGEIAVAYSEDEIAAPQQIREFAKLYKDSVVIAGGVFSGVYKNKEEMTEIAAIPGLQVLRGMFVNVINAPIQGLVLGLNAISEKKSA